MGNYTNQLAGSFQRYKGKTAGEEQLLTVGQPRIIGAGRLKGGKRNDSGR
jgi:hypothetical protein